MKLLAKPNPLYAKNPMHTNTKPVRSSIDNGSASSPMMGLRVNAMLVMGKDNACTYYDNKEEGSKKKK